MENQKDFSSKAQTEAFRLVSDALDVLRQANGRSDNATINRLTTDDVFVLALFYCAEGMEGESEALKFKVVSAMTALYLECQ